MDEIRYLSREIIAAYPPTCSLVTKLRGTLGNIIVSKTYNILKLQNNQFKTSKNGILLNNHTGIKQKIN
jgi:hypothetical protein